MALTDEQLATIKTKIETDKVRPRLAIKELFPDEELGAVRKQLFAKYSRSELIAFSQPEPNEITKEQKIDAVNNRIATLEKRKASLLEKKTKLEAEE